jgi:RimJ/RimL family protein N-acetyltransferase
MHQKLGFQIEGQRRQNIFKNGAYHDEIILGLLRDDWQKLKN